MDEKFFRTISNRKRESLWGNYPYGFHIFKSLKVAKNKCKFMSSAYAKYAICKVEIIESQATGIEYYDSNYCHVIVAKKMKIVEKIC